MKATLVISEEYKDNEPSVFIITNGLGAYYGDLTYARLRDYPDSDYWKTATSPDSDRGFEVKEVEYDDLSFVKIMNVNKCFSSCKAMIKPYPSWMPLPTYRIKRGADYNAYLNEKFRRSKINAEIANYNKPFEKAARAAYRILIDLILNTYTEL